MASFNHTAMLYNLEPVLKRPAADIEQYNYPARRCHSVDLGCVQQAVRYEDIDDDLLQFLNGEDTDNSNEEETPIPAVNKYAIASYGKETCKSPRLPTQRSKGETESAKIRRRERNRVLALESRRRKEQGMEHLVKENDILRNRNKMLSDALAAISAKLRDSKTIAEKERNENLSIVHCALTSFSLLEENNKQVPTVSASTNATLTQNFNRQPFSTSSSELDKMAVSFESLNSNVVVI